VRNAAGPAVGQRRRRVEDGRLITGQGRFAGDVHHEGQTYLAIRRSHLPHARVQAIRTGATRSMPGVIAVFTMHDLPEAARYVHDDFLPPGLAGFGRPVLADTEVNYLGDAIAVVIARDPYVAADGAAAIEVDLDPLPASGTLEAAIAAGAPLVHAHLQSNIGFWGKDGFGDIESAFGPGAVMVKERLVMNRICGAAIEPRAAAAVADGDGVTVWTSTQAIFLVRDRLARCLELDPKQVTVLAEDVGGGFGPKGRTYPEEVLVAWAAMKLGRPVKWIAGRSEDSITSMHGHGTVFELELAADPDGRLRGLRGRMWHDMGAYPSIGAITPARILEHIIGAYRLPSLSIELQVVFTNATPTSTVRGGGGPEGNFAIERMMDSLASRLGISPTEIRRRNLVPADALPYKTSFGRSSVVLHGGDFRRMLDEAQKLMGSVSSSTDGRLHGIGVAIGVEHTGGSFKQEAARVRIDTSGVAEVFLGSTPQGQSHQTMAAQLVADRLGWPIDQITVTTGDSRWLLNGGITAASRSAVHVGNAVSLAARAVRSALLEHAGEVLEIEPADLELEGGFISARGLPATRWAATEMLPDGGIDVTEVWLTRSGRTSPTSCHVAEVVVDTETGAVEVLRYVIVYDSGREINPLVVEGQLHGGLAHGIGYALFEEVVFDTSGEFQTPTFLDYSIPSSPEVAFQPLLASRPTETDSNPEGIQGVGETGTVAAPAAIAAAIEAAIRQVAPSATISELPVLPSRVLGLIAQAEHRANDAASLSSNRLET
jgi:carbon-monoxide dehydrogenase large subunit